MTAFKQVYDKIEPFCLTYDCDKILSSMTASMRLSSERSWINENLIRIFLWSFVGQTQSPNNNMSLLYNIKQHRFHVAVGVYSKRPQRTSKCGKIISDTLGCASSTRSLPHFDVISYLSQNRLTAHGICLLSITQHKLKNLYSFSGSPIVCENANWLFFSFSTGL